jgi:hypothetical protein
MKAPRQSIDYLNDIIEATCKDPTGITSGRNTIGKE